MQKYTDKHRVCAICGGSGKECDLFDSLRARVVKYRSRQRTACLAMMTELVSLAIGAIGALIGFAGLLLLGGVVFAVALAVKNLPLGLRAALSAFATYCFAASLLGNHALESMDILMVRTISDANTCLPGLDSSFIIGGQFFIQRRKFREAAAFDTSGKYIIASSFFLYVRRRNSCSDCSFCPLIICFLFLILRKVTKNQTDKQMMQELYRRFDRCCADFSFLVFIKKRAHI